MSVSSCSALVYITQQLDINDHIMNNSERFSISLSVEPELFDVGLVFYDEVEKNFPFSSRL